MNIYAMMMFLLVITTTSSVLCSSSNNDGEILMVVEEKTSYVEPGIMAQTIPVQLGRFGSKDGKKSVTLSRRMNNNGKAENCIAPDQPCGLLDRCCEALVCDGIFDGRCHVITTCLPKGSDCTALSKDCCYPYTCVHPGQVHGTCS